MISAVWVLQNLCVFAQTFSIFRVQTTEVSICNERVVQIVQIVVEVTNLLKYLLVSQLQL